MKSYRIKVVSPENSIIVALIIFGIFLVGRWLTKALTITWVKQIVFEKKSDLKIDCDGIDGGRRQIFKVRLNSGKLLKVNHDRLVTYDDFEEFKKGFTEAYNDTKKP